jgi:L-rhamnose mutarotase
MKRNKYAWTWTVAPEHLSAYVALHRDPWPEVLEEHRKAGIKNYSIFQNGNQFFYCYECEDVAAANAYIAQSEACARWNALTSKMVVGSFDFNAQEPIAFMPEVFYLP